MGDPTKENNLLKVFNDLAVGLALQVRVEADEGELKDDDEVLWAEPLSQEVAASLHNVQNVELIGCKQQLLHIVLRHRQTVSVCKLSDELHHVRRQAWYDKDLLIWSCPVFEESSVGQDKDTAED
ncbi:hypothetical protein ABVT39_014782 [Epinephelus coioides]